MKTFFDHINASQNSPFFIEEGKKYSYKHIELRIIERSKSLRHQGIKKGHLIAFQRSSPIDFFIDLFALWKLDAIAVPFSPKAPLEEIKKWHKEIPFSFLIQKEKVLKLSTLTSTFGHEGPCLVILTSGSSGQPKGVVLEQKNLYYSALGTNQFYSLGNHDRWGLTLPPHHIGGLMIGLRCLIAGASVVIKHKSQNLTEFINTEKPTFLSLVPHQLKSIINSKLDHSLKAILVGGAQVSNSLMKDAKRQRLPLSPTYGLSEMASQVTAQKPRDFLEKKDIYHLGSPLPYRNLKIGSKGKVILEGPTSFLGYIINKELTPSEKKWISQDLGELTKTGNLIIKGRVDNIFISGGENINPVEIEEALIEHQDIEEVHVVPVPHSKFEKVPFAFYKSKKKLTKEELSQFLKDKIHPFKKPKYYFPNDFSYQGIKPQKSELKKKALAIIEKENSA
ncbi:AMP-binding protein [Bacteriovoracales bacterium]|nr:AMP-binding protein [Bacteriovoracales bacterium]